MKFAGRALDPGLDALASQGFRNRTNEMGGQIKSPSWLATNFV